MRQVLDTRTVLLHLRNMFNAFSGAEAQNQKSIRDLVHSLLYREEGLREVQSMDRPNGNMITTKREIQIETHGRRYVSLRRTDGTETIHTEILKLPSDGLKNIVHIWIRSCKLISHRQLQENSVKDVRTILLLASMVTDQSRDQ